MPDYQKLYCLLFNAITDALELMDDGEVQAARRLLTSAQLEAEEAYICAEG